MTCALPSPLATSKNDFHLRWLIGLRSRVLNQNHIERECPRIRRTKKGSRGTQKNTAECVKRTEEEVHSNLESLYTSDLLPALVGLVWLTVGITMSTLSTELSRWFH